MKPARDRVVVAGLGEVGKPLAELLAEHYEVVGVDVEQPPLHTLLPVRVLHVCYPYTVEDFVGETLRYIEGLRPALTIIDSTVAVGTTRRIAERSGARVVHSPVRGKHAVMLDELRRYTKHVGADDAGAAEEASEHFARAGLQVEVARSSATTELAKLAETAYFGLLIAWAQELERYCDDLDLDYDDVVSFFDEIGYLPPVRFFPGVIGGHCVMPNLDILAETRPSGFVELIRTSNRLKIDREADQKEG
jgi:UDP-N-acetyl-D-mannosaminuronate dehydrogenase